MTKKQERINKLMIYLPHLTREQAEKHVTGELELERIGRNKSKSQRKALGWK